MPETPDTTADGEFAAIYAFIRTIPAGKVLSYGEVGVAVSATARTVGWALGMTPKDVPWQRVVGADGYLRIARRSPDLAKRQRELLEKEGVAFNDKGCVERRFFLVEDEKAQAPTEDQGSLPGL